MSALLIGLCAAAASAPLVAAWRRGRALRAGLPLLLGVAAMAAATLAAPVPAPPPDDRPIEVPADGYVGSQRCRACHPGEHASWHASFHRTMTQPCTPATLQADFGPDRRLELDYHGTRVVLAWRGDVLFVEHDDFAGRSATRRRHEVVQLTGSHHAQVLWYATGLDRQLAAVPMAYRVAERRWLPIDAVFLMPQQGPHGLPAGMWNENCNSCHATRSRPRVDRDPDGTARADTLVAEFGVACEACHGPGAAHVAANRDPLRRYGLHLGADAGDPTVVNPARLDAARDPEVCGQCHSVSILRRRHFDAWREHGSPFRPGQVLADSKLVVTAGDTDAPELVRQQQQDPAFFRNTFWPDGHVRVTGREFNGLVQSPCHAPAAGDRAMTCLSCHDMHPDTGDDRALAEWRQQQLRPGMTGDAACTQCHPQFVDAAARRAHTHHDAGAASCYDCHMPRTGWGLLKSVRSHVVSSPDVATELATGRPNACNLCHLDQPLQWSADHLAQWYGTAAPALDADQRDVAAGVRWLLTGDAAQRALAAAAAGRAAAHRAAGTDWLRPYLGQLLADPYYAVRFVAARSLTAAGGEVPAGYDHLADDDAVAAAAAAVHDAFRRGPRPPPRPAVLLGADGLRWQDFRRLLARRDDRPIVLAE